MSQFMNGAKRLKGWKPVEKMIEEWLVVHEHDQAILDQYENEDPLCTSCSSSESVSSSPRTINEPVEPAVRNVYNRNQVDHVQVTMHSHMVVPECRQEQMYEADPAPAFEILSYAMPYQEYYGSNDYSDNYMERLNTSSDSWNYETSGYENYSSSPENYY